MMRVPITKELVEKLKTNAAEAFGVSAAEVKIIHISPAYTPCDHDWPEDERGTDMSGCCTKCGMSFIRHIHMECP
jgi:hypothetical protein